MVINYSLLDSLIENIIEEPESFPSKTERKESKWRDLNSK